jgi:ATP-binding cassette, subfamily G (WHITE), member 2
MRRDYVHVCCLQPTSGLDSYTANEVMTVVKSLVSDGITICATIHSPSPYCFSLFDRLLVLVRGETVYHGPNGPRMVDYFKTGCGVQAPKSVLVNGQMNNDADFLTDLVVGADREGRAHEYADAYEKSAIRAEMMEICNRGAKVRSCVACVTCWKFKWRTLRCFEFLRAVL